ncbi:MAG: hypothetical protein A3J28_15945 [Acidobacteria bacterium RIFCSPLOWO2_12_FULL_60_22]|nr:MAG: hypothetical protein A3J28_15945 [Acidobacteria bacterium RIFCSPLOWO2_12_FULL_60_22]
MDTVLECHGRLAAVLGSGAESVDVLRRAEEHRWYWRPEQVKVVLLAESHVYTTPEELARTIALPASAPPDLPRGFVRLVYCLGYGENRLLNRPIESPANAGTPPFWKIFFSCANAIATNSDFAPILKTKSPAQEIANKLVLLRRLRELGVWLLDTSLAALYLPGRPKMGPAALETCLQIGWDHHVRHVVEAAAPSHIVCIGKGVARALRKRLSDVGVRVTVVPQPNARLASADHHESFRTYYRVVREANELV